MKLEPQSENGKILVTVQANWIEKSPDLAVDELKRMFLISSLKLKDEDAFITVLYAQKVVDESPSVLSQKFPSALLRVQHAIGVCLDKRCVKELVVALELSENQSFLTQVLNWTEKNSKDIQESIEGATSSVDLAPVKEEKPQEVQGSIKSVSMPDLAPVKVQKRKLLPEIMSGTVTPRHREISWTGKQNCTVLEVYDDKIVVGWDNGRIGNNIADLNCQTGLTHRSTYHVNVNASVTCLQCTGTEIIAGYSDGNVSVWDVRSETVVQTLCGEYYVDTEVLNYDRWMTSAVCMRWRAPKLIVLTDKGNIYIWQYASSSFTSSGGWNTDDNSIRYVDFNDNYVILGPSNRSESIRVHHTDGRHLRSISGRKRIIPIALQGNHLITRDWADILQIWNILTGDCLKELKTSATFIETNNGVVVSCNGASWVSVWNIKRAQLDVNQAQLASFSSGNSKCIPFADACVDKIKLGPNFLVATSGEEGLCGVIFVTDFPS